MAWIQFYGENIMISFRQSDLLDKFKKRPWKPGDRVRVHRDKLQKHDDWHKDMVFRDEYIDNIGTLEYFDVKEKNPLVKVLWDKPLITPNDPEKNGSYWHLNELERA